jgi:quaternary ammonium compound-resistance protein SugE
MNWIYLLLAGFFEIGWTIGLKQIDNHKNILWTAIFYISIITSFYFLQQALKVIPIGTANAIYTSIGAIGTVIIGMIFFNEPATLIRIGFILLII